ncbi:MAG TPA: M20 family metallopeptidase [Dehalococcoidia bacterium]|nr:M20 family metallopeptidase [Dehalococcoidia bacterium]
MATVADVSRTASELKDQTIALRREFHQHPELAYEEVDTAARIVSRLQALGLQVESGIGVTGVLAFLEGARPGKTVLIRADMDALPMPEEPADRPHRSQIENRNHACGHDMNMALAVATAEVLARHRDQISGQVAFVFQPGDEPQTGAKRMIDDGLWDKVSPDYVITHHPTPEAEAGKVVIPDTVWCSMDIQKLTIKGNPGWFGRRQDAVDAALIASQLMNALYPAMLGGGSALQPVYFNVSGMQGKGMAPGLAMGEAELQLTLWLYDKELRDRLMERMHAIIDSTVKAMGGTYEIESLHSLPPAVNSPEVIGVVEDIARELVGEGNVIRQWRNVFPDDSALFLEKAPGCMFLLGTNNAAKGIDKMWHQPGFDIDEETLPLGVSIMAQATLNLLAR